MQLEYADISLRLVLVVLVLVVVVVVVVVVVTTTKAILFTNMLANFNNLVCKK